MSVQAGIWNLSGAPVTIESLARMGSALKDHGPDGETTYLDGPIGLLHRPFHTTLESRLERQPHVSATGRLTTWNGRLDNRDELEPHLRDLLKGDRTDVAIAAAAFDRWGTPCFAKLVGDWAISTWDPRERELILARDYIGIRHLFYYSQPTSIVWCSHLAPLALYGAPLKICDAWIAGYLAFYPDAHITPYREIHSVLPGSFVRITATKSATTSYWSFDTGLRTRYKTDAEYEEHYRHLFRQAVRRRLRSDSVVLADLSGGLDSSSIVCMADDILAKEGAQTPRLDTFSFYDRNEPDEDDLPHLTKVEDSRGRKGFHANLESAADFLFEGNEFVGSPSPAQRPGVKAAISEVVRLGQHRVLLSGEGGDEMNGQALDPRVQLAELILQFRWPELAKQLTAWSLLLRRQPYTHLLFQTLLQLTPTYIRAGLTNQGTVPNWIQPRFAETHEISARQIGSDGRTWFLRPAVRDASDTVATLSRRLTSSGPCIIERRYPFLDQQLVEFLTSISLDQLIRPGQRRSLMRRALGYLLPPEILSRRTKSLAGRFPSIMLRRHWNTMERVLPSLLISRLGYVDGQKFREAVVALRNGILPVLMLPLLNAIRLEFWLRDALTRNIISIRPDTPLSHHLHTGRNRQVAHRGQMAPIPRGLVD
jgi:asparagine synthase (glutamine-hydrolysing)